MFGRETFLRRRYSILLVYMNQLTCACTAYVTGPNGGAVTNGMKDAASSSANNANTRLLSIGVASVCIAHNGAYFRTYVCEPLLCASFAEANQGVVTDGSGIYALGSPDTAWRSTQLGLSQPSPASAHPISQPAQSSFSSAACPPRIRWAKSRSARFEVMRCVRQVSRE